MSNALSNYLDNKSYTLFLSSNDKISGNNNNATFNVNWDDFLPRDISTYKMTFSFQSGGGNYKDTSVATITGTIANKVLTVTAATATIYTGMKISGNNITNDTYIISNGTGNGGVGTYNLSRAWAIGVAQQFSGSVVYSGIKLSTNLQGRSYSYDTNTLSPSNTLGYAQRDMQTTTSNSNSFSTFYLQFAPKMISRPSQNNITISLYNLNNNLLLTDTDSAGKPLTDCTIWNMILEFIPVN